MNSATTPRFRQALAALPKEIQSRARKAYYLWRRDHGHPSLHFKKVGKVWSARVTSDYRALAVVDGDTAIWFWIGSHADYELLLSRLNKS